jgi:hypothetical protein
MNPLAHWMYNIKTREAKLFNSVDDYNADEWVDTPALCDAEEQELAEEPINRIVLLKEAVDLGLEFPKNIPNERLLNMIEVAKIENAN